MKPITFTFAFLAAVAFLAAPAWADWDPDDGHKMHFPQLPDLTENGLDVLAGPSPWIPEQEKFLADDWLCTESGPVLDIHFWGSYNWDLELMDPLQTAFSLVIFEDVPADVDGPYSHPGAPLWSTYVRPTNARIYANADEGFYDPNQNEIVGFDTEVWQFNFELDPSTGDVFFQEEGTIYWLGVHHTFDLSGDGIVDSSDFGILQLGFPAAFGWKTADTNLYPPPNQGQHFQDDAVWTDVSTWLGDPHVVPGPGQPWQELIHPLNGQSLDLSFVITIPEPASAALFFLGVLGGS